MMKIWSFTTRYWLVLLVTHTPVFYLNLHAKDRASLVQDVPLAITALAGDEVISSTIPSIPSLVAESGAGEKLRGKGPFTVLVPTVQSLRAIPDAEAQALLGNQGALSNFVDGLIIPYSWDLLDRDFFNRPPQTDPNLVPPTLTVSIFVSNLRGHPMEIKIVDDGTTTTVTINGIPLTGRAQYATNGCVFEVAQPILPPPTLGEYFDSQTDQSITQSMLKEAGWVEDPSDGYYTAPPQYADFNPNRTFFVPKNVAWTSNPNLGLDPNKTNFEPSEIDRIESIANNLVVDGYVDFTDPSSVTAAAGAVSGMAGAGIYYDRDVVNGVTNLGVAQPRPSFSGPPVVCQEGLVYPIDHLLLPPDATREQIIAGDPELQEVNFFYNLNGLYQWKPGSTLFAPNNEAFRSLPGDRINEFFVNTAVITQTYESLEMNRAYGSQFWSDQPEGNPNPLWSSCNGEPVSVVNIPPVDTPDDTPSETPADTVNGTANIIRTNIVGRDGIIHVIDQLFDPIPGFLESLPQDRFSKFIEGITTSGVPAKIEEAGRPVTILAPTDAAFEAAGINDLNTHFANQDAYNQFFENHVSTEFDYDSSFINYELSMGGLKGNWQYAEYYGQTYSRDVEMLSGQTVNFTYLDEQLTIGNASPLTNTLVSEGVLYETNEVYLPVIQAP